VADAVGKRIETEEEAGEEPVAEQLA